MLLHALLSHVSKAARNAQGVDAVLEEVEGRATRRMAEEIFCHDHETTRQRSNLIGGGCGGARGEEKKTRTRNNESDGWCTLEKRGDGRNEVILKIYQRYTQCLCFPFGRT